jgi:hypothetical protein
MTDPHHVLFPDDPSPLAKWRRDNEQREQGLAAEREREERTTSGQVESLRAEVAALRGEIAELRAALEAKASHNDLTEVLNAVREITTKQVPGWIMAAVRKSEAATAEKVATRFGELMGRIAAIDPATARAAKGEAFRFASEKGAANDEPVELPNWRTSQTIMN